MAQASDSDPVPSSPRRRRSVKRKLLSDIVEQSPSKRTRSQNVPKSPKKSLLIENKPSTPNKDKINAKSFYGGAKSKYVTPLERKEQKEKAQHSGLKEIQNQFHFASTSESSDNSSKSNNSKKSTKGTKPKKKVAHKSNSSHILQGKPKVAATNRRSDPPPRKFTLNTPPAKSKIASVLKEESNGDSQAETESTNPSPESQVSIGSSGSSTKRFFKHQASPGKKARSSGPQVSLRKGLQLTFHRPNVRNAIEERVQLDDMVSKKGLNPKEDLLPSLSKKKLDKKAKKSNVVSIKIGVEPKRTKKPFENPFSQDLFDDFSSDLAQDISADSFTANLSEEGSSISRGFPSKSDSACHSLSTVNGTPSKLSTRLNSPRKSLNLTPSKRPGLRSNTGTPIKSQSSVSPDSAKADSVMLISEVSSERSLPSEGWSYKDSPQNTKKVFSIFAKSLPGTKPGGSRGSTPTNSEPGTPESQRSSRGARSASRTSKHMLKSLVDKEGREQMILDFGQRLHGATQCDTCGMTYTEGEPSDETTHAKFHRNVISALKFNGWKKERICMENPDGSRIIVVTSEDKFAIKKVEAVRQIVDSELGFVVERRSLTSSMKTFLYISEDKQVIGCCIAEEIRKGYRMLADSQSNESQESVSGKVWCCSTKPTSAKCGISRIWVFSCARRKKIASQLLDCVRCHFLMGYALRKDELAFSDPTPDGRRLASKYCETPCFLVYKHNDSPLSSQV